MVELTFPLGRDVPTAREVLEVIRPHLRMAAVAFPAIHAAFLSLDFVGPDKDDEASLGGADQAASDAMFDGLREDALSNVADWARDVGKVYGKEQLVEFVGTALNECANGEPSDAVLDVLALDEGVCEDIAETLVGLNGGGQFEGMAARYRLRV